MDNSKTANQTKKKARKGKPNFFVRTWGKIKEIFSELKKVTWPSFATVLKQLGCVLVIVVLFLAIILLIDLGLTQLLHVLHGTTGTATLVGRIF